MIPSLSIDIEFECKNDQWEPEMLIGGLCYASIILILSSVVGMGSLIDESQNAVWPLVFEDEFHRIMKIAINYNSHVLL